MNSNPRARALSFDRMIRSAAGAITQNESNNWLSMMKRYGIPTIGTGTSMGGITTSSIKYRALGLESLRPAMPITGIATSANHQKLGLRNAVAVRAYQTLRRRERSSGAMNNSAIGFASLKIIAAITET